MVHQFALVLLLLTTIILIILCLISSSSGCDSKCGKVEIPYPFGMNHPNCFSDNKWFEIECRNNNTIPFLKAINLQVIRINVADSLVLVMNPTLHFHCRNKRSTHSYRVIDMRGSPFVYSQLNKFVGVGCNTQALLLSNESQVGGCVSICHTTNNHDDEEAKHDSMGIDSCHGRYCCVTSVPLYLSEFKAVMEDTTNTSWSRRRDDDCSYAQIVDPTYLGSRSVRELRDLDHVGVVLEWEILDSSLQLPHDHNCYFTNVTSSQNTHSGRRCQCGPFTAGNPYVEGGCIRDIQGLSGAKPEGLSALGIILSSLVTFVFLVGVWIQYKIFRKSRMHKRRQKYFKQNGGNYLLQRRSFMSHHGDIINFEKTKLFNSKDLEKATDRFSVKRVLGKGSQGTVYKGMLADGQIVAVKKYMFHGNVEEFINEVIILSQVNHRNVVKLLGFCLETQVPLLVYEFIPNGNLYEYLHDDQNNELSIMTWDMRLRIASEVAGALYYLHSAASRPIYHRDIKSTNILLDEKHRAKVADFGTSRMVSIGNTHLTTLLHGTFGYMDPEYFQTSQFTEKSDVYSFGVVLVELLTGQKPIMSSERSDHHEAKSLASYFLSKFEEEEEECLFDIVDRRIMMEGEIKKEYIMGVARLAKRCLSLNGRNRPSMKEVTMELEGIQELGKRFSCNNNAGRNFIEESDIVGFEGCEFWSRDSTLSTGSSLNKKASSSSGTSLVLLNN